MHWVENGEAPDRIIASRVQSGVVVGTRPLCAYPYVTRYDGKGDPNSAESFKCKPNYGPLSPPNTRKTRASRSGPTRPARPWTLHTSGLLRLHSGSRSRTVSGRGPTARRSSAAGAVSVAVEKNTFELAPMWAAIVLIGVLGSLSLLFLLAEHRILAWHRGWRAATPQ